MKARCLFAFIAIAMLCLNAGAITVKSPGTIYLYAEPKEVRVKITNESSEAKSFSVEFSAPTQFELSQFNGTIAGKRSKTITLTIFPKSDLVGQTYKSKLQITLGNERIAKQLTLVFRGPRAETSENKANETTGPATGLFGLFAMPALENTATEFALNTVLIAIAAVLLIAFIARFIKRMEGR